MKACWRGHGNHDENAAYCWQCGALLARLHVARCRMWWWRVVYWFQLGRYIGWTIVVSLLERVSR